MNLLAEDLNVANIHTAASMETTRNPGRTKRIEVRWRNWTYMKTELLSKSAIHSDVYTLKDEP